MTSSLSSLRSAFLSDEIDQDYRDSLQTYTSNKALWRLSWAKVNPAFFNHLNSFYSKENISLVSPSSSL